MTLRSIARPAFLGVAVGLVIQVLLGWIKSAPELLLMGGLNVTLVLAVIGILALVREEDKGC